MYIYQGNLHLLFLHPPLDIYLETSDNAISGNEPSSEMNCLVFKTHATSNQLTANYILPRAPTISVDFPVSVHLTLKINRLFLKWIDYTFYMWFSLHPENLSN